MSDDHFPPQISEETLFSSHSLLFYNVFKLPENCSKKTRKKIIGPGPESYKSTKFSVFLQGRFSQQFLTKFSSSQTISHQPSPHKGIYYHSWHQKTNNHGDATIILFASASSWFSETWISNPSESILPKISVSRTCHLYFLTIITIILQCKILELGSLGFKF